MTLSYKKVFTIEILANLTDAFVKDKPLKKLN